MFLKEAISLFESTTTALEAATVPAVTPSIVSSSASEISAEPITKLVPVMAVPVMAAALEPPMIAPSTVPPFMSAVSATRLSIFAVPSMYKFLHSCVELPKSYVLSSSGMMCESTSAPKTTLSAAESPNVSVPPLKVVVPVTVRLPPTSTLPVVVTVVNAPVEAELAPMVAPSTVPPFISAVSATKASVVTVPSKYASLNSTELVPKSMSLSVTGTIAPSWILICSTAALETSTNTPQRLLVLSATILFKKSKSPIVCILPPCPAVPSCL